ncbi:TfoX/Sxy family protein [Caulobacter sp. ErkDOM-E]|uniref:TfoX/Sxy family protein n=1 Tax=Caulobacter sp. ErkDOM-E TaxID=3402778 RepID=UPI003AF9AA84
MSTRRIGELRGLGSVSARWLESVGIIREDDLRAIGAVEAFARVRLAAAPDVSLNLLYALEGALRDVDWRVLPSEVKQSLRTELSG